jgi:hypothetical protein
VIYAEPWRNLKSFSWKAGAAMWPWGAREETPLPQPRLTVRVGVSGHLDLHGHEPRVDPVLREVLSSIRVACGELKGGYESCFRVSRAEEPCLRLVTSLAAGADQLAAQAAVDLAYTLQVVLPADREEFAKDVADNHPEGGEDAVAKFADLRSKAEAVFELDGQLGYEWRQRWLNYRRLERHLNAAACLALLGRTVRLLIPA